MHDDVLVGDHDHELESDWSGERPKTDFYYADNIELTTVGMDIGSSTSHLMFSRLHLQRLGQFLSSRYVVVSRETLYRSPVLLTPYTADYNINASQLNTFIREAYEAAGLRHDDVDSGAIILTGEAVKRHNARAIADLFANQAGKFVCASAGANLESIMAAHGSGAVALSRHPPQTILNVDVGGGTSKLALIRDGEILQTAAINVGGRLVALDSGRRVVRIEPAARTYASRLGVELQLGQPLAEDDGRRLAGIMADCLISAVRREPPSPLVEELLITPPLNFAGHVDTITFSGGVSEYVYERENRDFGDLARPLAAAIRERTARFGLPASDDSAGERIRATVIGASQFTVQVSGNTIAVSRTELLPLHNLQVISPRLPEREDISPDELLAAIRRGFERLDLIEGEQAVAIALNWQGTPLYPYLRNLAEGILNGLPATLAAGLPLVLVFDGDYGELVGEIMREDFEIENDIVSIDNISLAEFDYIDIGEMILPSHVVPVVVKSLMFPGAGVETAELLETGQAPAG